MAKTATNRGKLSLSCGDASRVCHLNFKTIDGARRHRKHASSHLRNSYYTSAKYPRLWNVVQAGLERCPVTDSQHVINQAFVAAHCRLQLSAAFPKAALKKKA